MSADRVGGWFCTETDTCQAGSCQGSGEPCPGPDGDDNCAESCDEGADDCSANDVDHSPCLDDGFFCTGDEVCQSGLCVGSGDPCPGPDGDVDCAESCDEINDWCFAPDPEGSPCPGGSCHAGTCEPDP